MTYQITLSGDGTQFQANTEQTLLQAAIEQGVRLPYGCNNGLCFGCLQEIESGETEYREPVTDVGDLLKYQTMTCKAYATSDVVLKASQLPDLSKPETTVTENQADTEKNVSESSAEKAVENQTDTSNTDTQTLCVNHTQSAIFPAKVIRNTLVCDDTRQIDLRLPAWVDFRYLSGQYLDVVLDSGERRSFSIAEYDIDNHLIRLYIKRVENGVFTGYVFEHLLPETVWRIDAPLGHFVLHDSQRPILMLATSTGIAPMQAILQTLNTTQATRRVHLYWGQRYAKRLYADDSLTQLALSNRNMAYTPVISRPNGDEESQCNDGATQTLWQGRSGYVQHAAISDFGDLSAFDIYVAGSPAVIEAVVSDCVAAGAQREHLYLDVFNFQTKT